MAVKTFLLLLASSYVASGFLSKECPPPESTTCHCVDPKRGVYLCYDISSQKSLEDNIEGLRGHFVQKLSLSHVNASTFPADLFKGLHVKELDMYEVEMSDLKFEKGHSYFLGLEKTLETLRISYSFKEKSPFANLKLDHLQSLKHVYLSQNKIPEIGNDWFPEGPESIVQFSANSNGITKLGSLAFLSLKNLEDLLLQRNYLKEISRAMLPYPANRLERLDLSFNFITTLPKDMFKRMPSLRQVNMGHNLIHALLEDTWSPVFFNLETLNLVGNHLQCDDDLKWVCDENYKDVTAGCNLPAENKELSLHAFCAKVKL